MCGGKKSNSKHAATGHLGCGLLKRHLAAMKLFMHHQLFKNLWNCSWLTSPRSTATILTPKSPLRE
jgi:hypothetical protein